MTPLNAVVKKGRLTLDEPCDLPEGQVVVLLSLEELLAEADGVPPQQGVTLQIVPSGPPARSRRRSKVVDAKSLIDELRSL